MPSRPTTERRFATASNKVNRLFNSRVYIPTPTISSPVGVIGIGVTGSGIGFLIWRPGFGVWRQNRVWKHALDAGCRKKKTSGLRDLHRVGMTGLKNPIGYPLTACPDYMKQRLLETLATDIYFPLEKVWGANMETHVHASAARSPLPSILFSPKRKRVKRNPLGTLGIYSITHRINLYPQGIKQLFFLILKLILYIRREVICGLPSTLWTT